MTNEEELLYINRVKDGDSKVFSILIEQYKTMVFTLAVRMLKNNEDAEEAAQDTFLKAFKYLNNFKGDSKFSTWLYRIAYNNCLDRLKRAKVKYETVTIDEFTENKVRTLNTALDQIESKERNEIIKSCLEKLNSKDAFLLTLYYFDELTLEEIAKVLDISPNNVKVKLFRSRKRLATILKMYVEPEIIGYYEK